MKESGSFTKAAQKWKNMEVTQKWPKNKNYGSLPKWPKNNKIWKSQKWKKNLKVKQKWPKNEKRWKSHNTHYRKQMLWCLLNSHDPPAFGDELASSYTILYAYIRRNGCGHSHSQSKAQCVLSLFPYNLYVYVSTNPERQSKNIYNSSMFKFCGNIPLQ